MRRQIAICSTIPAAVAVVLIGLWWLQPRPRIDQETFDKIQFGMTEAEVIDIIGAPPGDYGIDKGELDVLFQICRGLRSRGWVQVVEKTWLNHDKAIVVEFDADGKVYDMELGDVYRPHDSRFDQILHWFHLKEKKPRWTKLP